MLDRLVVLVPCVGGAEILPSNVLPTDVLTAGPMLSFSNRDKELFWSMGAYHFQEVNEFASAMVGHTVKGDVCIVQTFPKGTLGFPGSRRLDELMKEWRFGAKLHQQSREESSLVGLRDLCFGADQVEDSISTTVESDDEPGMESDTSRIGVLNANDSVNDMDPPAFEPSLSPNIGGESLETVCHTSSTSGWREDQSRRQAAGTLPRNPPRRLRSTKSKVLAGGSALSMLDGDIEGKDKATMMPIIHWDELHPDILCWIARRSDSGKMVLVMCGVSSHWRESLLSDAPLLRSIPFRLNRARPLRNVCECCGPIQKTLHRRHIGSLPRILLKAAELSNHSAATSLANMYESCGMHVDAVQQWRKLSRTGDLHGSWKYGEALYNGKGIGRDAESAQHLLLRVGKQILRSDAPETGETLRGIGLCLGYLFLDGEAGKQDNEKAVQWFQVAAENGCPEAEITLGWMFNTGQYG